MSPTLTLGVDSARRLKRRRPACFSKHLVCIFRSLLILKLLLLTIVSPSPSPRLTSGETRGNVLQDHQVNKERVDCLQHGYVCVFAQNVSRFNETPASQASHVLTSSMIRTAVTTFPASSRRTLQYSSYVETHLFQRFTIRQKNFKIHSTANQSNQNCHLTSSSQNPIKSKISISIVHHYNIPHGVVQHYDIPHGVVQQISKAIVHHPTHNLNLPDCDNSRESKVRTLAH